MSRQSEKDDPKENPLSFRNFLTSQANGPSTSQASSNSPRAHIRTNILNDVEQDQLFLNSNSNVDNSSCQRRREPSEPSTDRHTNPYSFKRFLQQDTVRPVQSVRGDDNCIMVHGDLPDFVQDHFTAAAEGGAAGVSFAGGVSASYDHQLPDFALSLDHNDAASAAMCSFPSGGMQPLPATFQRHHPSDPGDLDVSSAAAECEPGHASRSGTLVLPDFLSDSGVSLPLMNGQACGEEHSTHSYNAIMNLHDSNIDQIRRDKMLLERDLRLCQNELQDREIQLERLRRRIRDKESREAEETTAMERMLKQVEQNLKEATERASRAENHNKKLKEEVRSLKTQIQHSGGSLGSPSDAVNSEERAIGERARQVGVELAQSAQEAETLIRQILSGVQKVKLVSETLQSIDKFSEPSS